MLLSPLPSSSFVPFPAKRLASPVCFWRNPSRADLDTTPYCFAVPQPSDNEAKYTNEDRVFYADRYGGFGVGANGGGARCGSFEDFQIKGIGRTPLAGSQARPQYSHGGASIEEALREAIWGEVCAIALPYGSCRVHAIILTGTQTPYFGPGGMRFSKRALVVRDNVLRPAHFMRALRYGTSDDVPLDDVARTKIAVSTLGKCFKDAYSLADDSPTGLLAAGLNEYAVRLARQLASAHVKRICHGSLSPSNVCLDGRWIDFGTISTISDFGRPIVAKRGADFHEQSHPLKLILSELRFFAEKYGAAPSFHAVPQAHDLTRLFDREFRIAKAQEYLRLAGFDDAALALLEVTEKTRFLDELEGLISINRYEPFRLLDGMPQTMGPAPLATVLGHAALSVSAEELEVRLKTKLGANIDWSALVAALFRLRTILPFSSFERWNCIRQCLPFRQLYVNVLDAHIQEIKSSEEHAERAVDSLVELAKFHFGSGSSSGVPLTPILGAGAHVSRMQGVTINGEPVSDAQALALARTSEFAASIAEFLANEQ